MMQRMMAEKIHYNIKKNEYIPLWKSAGTSGSVTDKTQRVTTTTITTENEAETAIAMNPLDSTSLVLSYMVYSSSTSNLSFSIQYSSDTGHNWQTANFSSQSFFSSDFPTQQIVGGGDPTFAWDAHTGRLYFSWIYLSIDPKDTNTYYQTLNWAYSDDNGVNWQRDMTAENRFIGQGSYKLLFGIASPTNYLDGISDREWLAVDNSNGPLQGTLYAIFLHNSTTGVGEAIRAKPYSIGSKFGAVQHIGTNINQNFGRVLVDSSGVLHAIYVDFSKEKLIHVSSSDGGKTFSSPHTIYSGNRLEGGAGVFYRSENAAPDITTDGKTLHVVWSDFPPGDSSVISYYTTSSDNGNTWSTPRSLNTFFGMQTLMPTIAVYGNHVTISASTRTSSSDSTKYYQIISKDGGTSFQIPTTTSFIPTYYQSFKGTSDFFGDYNSAVRSYCYTFAAWADGRDEKDARVYFSATNHCSTIGVPEITAVNSGINIMSLYPNPIINSTTLKINSNSNEHVTISIYSIEGKRVFQEKYRLNKGSQEISLNLENLTSGSYMLALMDEEMIATRQLQVVH